MVRAMAIVILVVVVVVVVVVAAVVVVGARKGRKVAKYCVFPMICCSGGSKSRLAKAAGAEPSGQMRDEQIHAIVARSTFRSQRDK